ncbi:acyltransferase 3 [Penicillium herquei]|nr:acyltransferase 3 [Penicillium herquei]
MGRTLWLDGLRGIASAIVAVLHAAEWEPSSILGFLNNSYWDDPPGENRHIIQLPPIRLLFAGSSMVSLFLVISGYAVSIPIIASRDEHALNLRFFHRICSASTRRVLRIYLPTMTILLISHFLYFMDVYHWDPPGEEWLSGLEPWKAPVSHITHVLRRILHLVDVTNKCINNNSGSCRWEDNNITLQLWTMPIEFRGSCVVYLLILTLAHWMRRPRLFALALVALYWFYIGQWDLFCFVAGLFLAERDIGLVPFYEANGEIELPCHNGNAAQTTFTKLRLAYGKMSDTKSFRCVCTGFCFILGMFFLCMTHNDFGEQTLSPEYKFLYFIGSPNWVDSETLSRSWKSVGAVLTIFAISRSSLLQHPLNSRPMQYLGKISFPLYLIHPVIYLTFKRPIRNMLWLIVTGTPYSSEVDAKNHPRLFITAWAGSGMICGLIFVVLSEMWYRFVDLKYLEIGRQFEKWVTHEIHR